MTAAEQIVNGGFDDGLAGWTAVYPNPAVIEGYGCVDVPAGTGPYGAGIGQLVSLEPNTFYEMTFVAKLLEGSGQPGPIRAVVQLPRDPYTQYLPQQAIAGSLSTAPQTFSFRFQTPDSLPPAMTEGDPAGPHAEVFIQQDGPTIDGYVLCVDDVSLVGGSEPPPYEPDTGPRVRVNHVGYLRYGPKHATVVTEATDSLRWQLLDGEGSPVATGFSSPRGVDPSAALNVHTIDFSAFAVPGDNYRLAADGETSFPFAVGIAEDYRRLRYDTLNYYYPVRSGIAIDGEVAGAAYARDAGHILAPGVGTNQGDFDVPCQSIANQTNDAGDFYYGSEWVCPDGYTLDVVGGWYDAGDHGKYVVNGGISVAQLMGIYERALWAPSAAPGAHSDGTLKIPERANGVPDVLDEARWELEWMMSMQVPAGTGPQLIDGAWIDVSGMAHHKIHDEGWTGLPLMPADDPQVRSLHRPSTAATLNLAAVAAQGARVFAPYDASFSERLLDAARVAYDAAVSNPLVLAPGADGAEGGGAYSDGYVVDEFYWAAAELYLTTGEVAYRTDVEASPLHASDPFRAGGFSWNWLAAIARLNLATLANDLPDRALSRASVVMAGEQYIDIQKSQPFGHPYAGDDGAYVWGSNSQILNNLIVLATAFDISNDVRFRDAVVEGMDYLLGRNALGWSYVTGYGEPDYNSVNQHSRWWANQLDPSLPNPPPGTIAGGPNSQSGSWDPVVQGLFGRQGCAPQWCYVDDIGSWSTNELTINWNAPMAWVASFLADQGEGDLSPFGDCAVRYQVHGRWEDGYNAQVWLTNTSDEPIEGWELAWAFSGDQTVDSGWSGAFAQDGAIVTVSNLAWNAAIEPGQSVTFGFIGAVGVLSAPVPTTFRMNGKVCPLDL